jgi:hypothetical protein
LAFFLSTTIDGSSSSLSPEQGAELSIRELILEKLNVIRARLESLGLLTREQPEDVIMDDFSNMKFVRILFF